MADVCTLANITLTVVILCQPAPVCEPEKDGKIFCHPNLNAVNICPNPPSVYDCKREDGTTYQYYKYDESK